MDKREDQGLDATEALKSGAMIVMHGGGGGGGSGKAKSGKVVVGPISNEAGGSGGEGVASVRVARPISPGVWAELLDREQAQHIVQLRNAEAGFYGIVDAGLIAIVNHSLPDADPRKITRSTVTAIRSAASAIAGEWGDDDALAAQLTAIADGLAAYLIPVDPSPSGLFVSECHGHDHPRAPGLHFHVTTKDGADLGIDGDPFLTREGAEEAIERLEKARWSV